MRLAEVVPIHAKIRATAREPNAERLPREERPSLDDIIRRRQILELFVEAAAMRCGSRSLRRRWNQDEREHEERASPDRARRAR